MGSNDAVLAMVAFLEAERERTVTRSSLSYGKEIASVPPLAVTIIEKSSNSEDTGSLESGKVSLVLKNGHKYEGWVEDGLMHGQGKFTWCDGTVYEGEFCKGVITGQGSYCWIDGSRYVGEVKEGVRHGEGSFYSSSQGIHYTGQWCEGRRSGKGKLVYDPDGESWYDGDWKNNLQCGWGTRQYSPGRVYEGEWEGGQRHGMGVMHWHDKGERYEGQWFRGVQHGQGEHIWLMKSADSSQFPLRNSYVGQWVEGKREGKGTFSYASGAQFIGTWLANKKDGLGKFVLPTGQTVEGVFKEDKMVHRTDGIGLGSVLSMQEIKAAVIHRPKTPLGSLIGDIDQRVSRGASTWQFNLQVSTLIPHTLNRQRELHQVHCMVLRYLTQLKKSYHMYSSLVASQETNHTLTRLQFWQILMDCNIHSVGLTLFQADQLIDNACPGHSGGCHNLTDRFLMREFLQSLVFIAHSSYKDQCTEAEIDSAGGYLSWCMDQFMKKCFLPGVCRQSSGYYHRCDQLRIVLHPHLELLHNIFTHLAPKDSPILTDGVPNCCPSLRTFILLIADCDLFVGTFSATTTAKMLLQQHPLAVDEDDFLNMELPMVFLEFLEALLGCMLLWYNARDETEPKEERPAQRHLSLSQYATAELLDGPAKTPPGPPDSGCHNASESGPEAEQEIECTSTGFQPPTSTGDEQQSVPESVGSETPRPDPLEQDHESDLSESEVVEDVPDDDILCKYSPELWQELVPLFIGEIFLPRAVSVLGIQQLQNAT